MTSGFVWLKVTVLIDGDGNMTHDDYAVRCEELFAVGGFAKVRSMAESGLSELGPDPALHRWLGLAHAAEDEDDHDAEAEAAYTAGLARWPDDLGLLVSYLELCLRAAEVAAALELLTGPWRAPLRLMVRHRVASYVVTFVLVLATNKALVLSGALSYSVWGWLWYIPLLLADAKLRQARRQARQRVIAAVEARHAETSTSSAAA
ncbi:hypothetical protein ACFYM0_01885 [Streptomyces sp. NPDC006487]|uniref:hypothetical protein n=1 Tax=Streptomyces sp. NPDC006487 TaxID=3364748 RepID=UPI0036897CF1